MRACHYRMEEKYALLQGLDKRPLSVFVDLVAKHFNALRVPLGAPSCRRAALVSMVDGARVGVWAWVCACGCAGVGVLMRARAPLCVAG